MFKILYGIQSAGNGHITRSSRVVKILRDCGFKVDVILSGNNNEILKDYEDLNPIMVKNGIHLVYSNGKVDLKSTIKTAKLKEILNDYKEVKSIVLNYDLIITDFEPLVAWAGKFYHKNVVAIGNQYSFLSNLVPKSYKNKWFNKMLINYFTPHDTAVGFHYKPYDIFISKPIIREEIQLSKPIKGEHYTVYLNGYTLDEILPILSKIKVKWHVFNNSVSDLTIHDNIKIFPIDKDLFTRSLVNSIGVITTGGFQTTSESLHMGKLLMVIPIENHPEQESNALSLSEMGIKTSRKLEYNEVMDWLTNYDPVKVNYSLSKDDIVKMILRS